MFTAGAQCGILPEQVLDMDLDSFKAVLAGYQDHLFDLKCIAVVQGYWSGYYTNSKHPKTLSTILATLSRNHKKQKSPKVTKPIVDADAAIADFIRREQRLASVRSK